ncbi:MAG: hypothetical protein KDD33_10565 [Bdellovibrionales bacterium]|nr:hypothetical protein [Bdellovibrionales bacterium]
MSRSLPLLLFSFIFVFSSLLLAKTSCPSAVPGANAKEVQLLKEWFDRGLIQIKTAHPTDTCRPDGYQCDGSYQCCGFCVDGYCDQDDSGGGGCRPDGAACHFNYDCCGSCFGGVCDQSGDDSCREDGLNCDGSYQCCNFCRNGICG